MMKEYQKIHSVFKRDAKGKFTDEYATPEIEYLKNSIWTFEEKVDGTNIRVHMDLSREPFKLVFGGRTDNAQIPASLVAKLYSMFPIDRMIAAFDPGAVVTLYGEGFGAKIGKGGGNYGAEQSFVLFDVTVGPWCLTQEAVRDVASKLGIIAVPILCEGTLQNAVDMTKVGFPSRWGNFMAEGLVLRPKVPLCGRNGDRIITKLKFRDWE